MSHNQPTAPPTVTARYHADAVQEQRLMDPAPVIASPGVTIEVTFALGRHVQAQAALTRALEHVMAQIMQASEVEPCDQEGHR